MARDQVNGSAPGVVSDTDATGRPAAAAGRRADRVPWLIALAVFACYAVISGYRYLRLASTSWDMGIFTEYVKRYAHLQAPIVDARAPGMNLLGDHFHPIVATVAPFFRLFPSPLTLLIAQALLAALSVIPVTRAAQQLLGTGAGRAIGVAYGLSWGLQQMIDNDFHEIAFAVPLLAFSLSALVRGRVRAAVLWALPLVLVKEDQGFTVAAIGLLIAFGYRHRIAGLALAAWGLAWSLLAITVLIPHFSPTHTYLYWSLGGNIGAAGHRASVAGLLHQVFASSGVKLPTLVMILLPTAFLALRSPIVLAVLPSLALRFIATNSAYWSTQWHYNATVMPIVFIAAIDGMSRIRAARAAAGTEMNGGPAGHGAAGRARPGTGQRAGPAGERRQRGRDGRERGSVRDGRRSGPGRDGRPGPLAAPGRQPLGPEGRRPGGPARRRDDAGDLRGAGLPVPAEQLVEPADLSARAARQPRPGRPWPWCPAGRPWRPTSTCWPRWAPGLTRSGSATPRPGSGMAATRPPSMSFTTAPWPTCRPRPGRHSAMSRASAAGPATARSTSRTGSSFSSAPRAGPDPVSSPEHPA